MRLLQAACERDVMTLGADIVRFIELVKKKDLLVLVLEFVEGGSVASLVDQVRLAPAMPLSCLCPCIFCSCACAFSTDACQNQCASSTRLRCSPAWSIYISAV